MTKDSTALGHIRLQASEESLFSSAVAGTKWLLLVFGAQELELLLDLGKAGVVFLDQVEATF